MQIFSQIDVTKPLKELGVEAEYKDNGVILTYINTDDKAKVRELYQHTLKNFIPTLKHAQLKESVCRPTEFKIKLEFVD